jgi:hypothetical protein
VEPSACSTAWSSSRRGGGTAVRDRLAPGDQYVPRLAYIKLDWVGGLLRGGGGDPPEARRQPPDPPAAHRPGVGAGGGDRPAVHEGAALGGAGRRADHLREPGGRLPPGPGARVPPEGAGPALQGSGRGAGRPHHGAVPGRGRDPPGAGPAGRAQGHPGGNLRAPALRRQLAQPGGAAPAGRGGGLPAGPGRGSSPRGLPHQEGKERAGAGPGRRWA